MLRLLIISIFFLLFLFRDGGGGRGEGKEPMNENEGNGEQKDNGRETTGLTERKPGSKSENHRKNKTNAHKQTKRR